MSKDTKIQVRNLVRCELAEFKSFGKLLIIINDIASTTNGPRYQGIVAEGQFRSREVWFQDKDIRELNIITRLPADMREWQTGYLVALLVWEFEEVRTIWSSCSDLPTGPDSYSRKFIDTYHSYLLDTSGKSGHGKILKARQNLLYKTRNLPMRSSTGRPSHSTRRRLRKKRIRRINSAPPGKKRTNYYIQPSREEGPLLLKEVGNVNIPRWASTKAQSIKKKKYKKKLNPF